MVKLSSVVADGVAYPFKVLGITRDSAVLKLGVVVSVMTYLANQPPPWTWGYNQMMAAASFGVGLLAAQLGTSRLPGKD